MSCSFCGADITAGSRFCHSCGADQTMPDGSVQRTPGSISDLAMQLAEHAGKRYALGGLLGRGGMGAVFKATDTTLDRPVAIKVLPPEMAHDARFVARFEREARTAAKLDHPNIIPIYAVESTAELYYFVMKFVAGRGLDAILDQGPPAIPVAQQILWQAATALGHAHTRGVIHRDIKPANIMIDEEGRAMLTDFGISKALQASTQFTATGQVIGTPHYMSPEQAKGLEVDGRSDQYSLAMVGYRMLGGSLPFGTDEAVHTILYKQIFEDPPRLDTMRPDLPAFLVGAIHKALSKAPADRYATMEEFATAVWPEHPVKAMGAAPLSGAMTGPSIADQPTEMTPATPMTPVPGGRSRGERPPPRKKKPVIAIAATVVVVLVGAGVGIVMMQQPASSPAAAPAPDTVTQVSAAPPAVAAPETTVTQAPPTQQPAPVTPPVRQTPPPQTRQPEVQRPAAPVEGMLTINAQPFGTVFIDDTEIGDTPLVNHGLRPGRHIIRVEREGYRAQVDTVDVGAGTTTRKNYVLIREGT